LKDILEASNEVCGELLFLAINEYVNILTRDKKWKRGNIATDKILSISYETMKI